MTKVLSSENIVNTTTDSWGECSLSCLDPNINNDPLITNYKFTADLMNKLEIGTGNQGTNDTISSLKGRISDFYLWDFPLTSEKIQNFVNCEDEDITYNHAKISWCSEVTRKNEMNKCKRQSALLRPSRHFSFNDFKFEYSRPLVLPKNAARSQQKKGIVR